MPEIVDSYPSSESVSDDKVTNKLLYSPRQASGGALLGGPIAAVYFIYNNYKSMDREESAKDALAYGSLATAFSFCLAFLLDRIPHNPGTNPGKLVSIAVCGITAWIVQYSQLSKEEIARSDKFDFQSTWKVIGVGLLCLAATLVLLFGFILLLTNLGLSHDA
jgi:hypothetical protein